MEDKIGIGYEIKRDITLLSNQGSVPKFNDPTWKFWENYNLGKFRLN